MGNKGRVLPSNDIEVDRVAATIPGATDPRAAVYVVERPAGARAGRGSVKLQRASNVDPASGESYPVVVPPGTAPAHIIQAVQRERIFRLAALGLSYDDIAERLRISTPTVYREFRLMRDERTNRFLNCNVPELTDEIAAGFDHVLSSAAKEAEAAETPRDRLAALQLMRSTLANKSQLLGNMGLLKKQPEQSGPPMPKLPPGFDLSKIVVTAILQHSMPEPLPAPVPSHPTIDVESQDVPTEPSDG